MIFIDIKNENILSFMQKEGIINIDDVQKLMDAKKKKKILEQHNYAIFQGKDGRWRTTIPDATRKSGRRLIAKSTLDDLEDVVVDYYTQIRNDMCAETDKSEANTEEITLRSLFPEWLLYKNSHTNASSYTKRIKADWNKYYRDDHIVDIPICKLTFLQLDAWAHDVIKKNNLTKKQYYNITVIMRQELEYACEPELHIIDRNPFSRVKIKKNLFYIKPIPKSETQVYLEDEQKIITKAIYESVNKRNRCISPLMILLNFQLGLRIGELCALKWSDIDGKYVNVQRMDTQKFKFDFDGEIVGSWYEVVQYTKTEAGTRSVYLNEEAISTLKIIKSISLKYGMYDDDYIYISYRSGKMASTRTLMTYIKKICKRINMQTKSNHKIRKTYISSLIDCGVNINTVREQAGHEDERTTLHNYCFDIKTKRHVEETIENAKNKIVSFKAS